MQNKIFLTEEEMEQKLIKDGYDIMDGDQCIDSCKVTDYACNDLGYESRMNQDTETLEFIK